MSSTVAAEDLEGDGHTSPQAGQVGAPTRMALSLGAHPLLDPLPKAVGQRLPLARTKPVGELWSLCCPSLKVCVVCLCVLCVYVCVFRTFTLGPGWPGLGGQQGGLSLHPHPHPLPERIIWWGLNWGLWEGLQDSDP